MSRVLHVTFVLSAFTGLVLARVRPRPANAPVQHQDRAAQV